MDKLKDNKIIRRINTISLLLISLLMFFSCDKEDMEGGISNYNFLGSWEATGLIEFFPVDERDYKETYLKFLVGGKLILIMKNNANEVILQKGTWKLEDHKLLINLAPLLEKNFKIQLDSNNAFGLTTQSWPEIYFVRILNSYLAPYLKDYDYSDNEEGDISPDDEEKNDNLTDNPLPEEEENNDSPDDTNRDENNGKDDNVKTNQFEEFYKNYLRLMGKQKSQVIELLKVNPKNSASSNPLLFNLYDDKINKVAIWFEKLKASYEQASLVEIYLSNKISQKSVLQELKNKYEYLVGTTASRKGWYHYFTRYNGNAVNIYYIPDYHEVVFDFYDMKDFTPGKYRN